MVATDEMAVCMVEGGMCVVYRHITGCSIKAKAEGMACRVGICGEPNAVGRQAGEGPAWCVVGNGQWCAVIINPRAQ